MGNFKNNKFNFQVILQLQINSRALNENLNYFIPHVISYHKKLQKFYRVNQRLEKNRMFTSRRLCTTRVYFYKLFHSMTL